ncbi:MAG: MATE family efflux transporter [Betaproteobacteria bacterium]|nr:MATE family efflux transporter [Betaproteobacteria bacterium]
MAEPITHRQVWAMAGPIVLANVSVPLLGAVDTAVVGHIGEVHYIGAVAIGAMLFNFIYHLFNCLRMGTTGPTAQARGAGDHAEVRMMLARALLLAAIVGGTMVALQLPILALAFWAIDASPQVEHYAREYFLVRVWALPAVFGTYAIIGWMYGLRNVRTPLVILLFTNGINIALDLLFVFGFGMGVAGVAAASLIAEYAGLALGLAFVARTLRTLPTGGVASPLIDGVRLRRMVAINGDIVLRTLCVVSVVAIFMAKSAELGDLPLAANQVLHLFLVFTSFGLDGFAHAAETILGEAVGRRDEAGFRQGRRMVFLWAGLVGLLFMLVYALFGTLFIALLTSIPEVRAAAADYLWWPVLIPLVSVWAYMYDGVYLAATRTRIMRNTVVVAFIGYLAVVQVAMPLFGNAGLWAAVATFLGLRGLLLHLYLPRVTGSIAGTAVPASAARS